MKQKNRKEFIHVLSKMSDLARTRSNLKLINLAKLVARELTETDFSARFLRKKDS